MDGSKKIVEANVIVGEIFARKKIFSQLFFFGLHLNLTIIRASNNPIFDLGSLRDFEDVENVSEMVAENQKRLKINKAKVLPVKAAASQIYPSGVWKKYLKINYQTRPRKTLTGVFLRSRVSFKLK